MIIKITLAVLISVVGFPSIAQASPAPKTSWIAAGPSRTINNGQTASIYAVSNGPVGMVSVLHQQVGKGWLAISIRKLDSRGKVAFSFKPRKTAVYRVYLAGNSAMYASSSRFIKVTVKNVSRSVAAEAAKYRGLPYRFGAVGPRAFDCSGYTMFVFRKFGKYLPHSANAQARYGTSVSKRAMKPGDLMLFGSHGRYYHAAIFAGGNKMYDAPRAGIPVGLHKVWSSGFIARRLV